MSIQIVIDELTSQVEFGHISEGHELYSPMIEALEKQLPAIPILDAMQNRCANTDCAHTVLRYYSFCPECGQKIDWISESNGDNI